MRDNCSRLRRTVIFLHLDYIPCRNYAVTCTVSDAAGNSASCTFDVTVVDNEPPRISCSQPLPVNNDPGVCGAAVNFRTGASDNCDGVLTASISCVDASGAPVASGDVFPVGSTVVTCSVRDAAGNPARCTIRIVVNDNEDPTITCPSAISVRNDPGQCGATLRLPAPAASDNCRIRSVVCMPPGGSFFPVGTTSVICTATDVNGNTASCRYPVTVRDSEPPTLSCPNGIRVSNDPGLCSASVGYSIGLSDNCRGAQLTCTPPSGSSFPVGTSTVVCTATDAAGNTVSCRFPVVVRDTEAPVIRCPQGITVNSDPGECGAAVSFATAARDNCDGDISSSISCVDANGTAVTSGDLFPVGSTTVVCSVSDSEGNGPAVCRFVVTVNPVGPDRDCDGVIDPCDVCDGGDDNVDNNQDGIPDCSQLFANINDYDAGWLCHSNGRKILVCHNGQSLCVNFSSLSAHFGSHGGQPGGDPVGPCVSCQGTVRNALAPAGLSLYAYPNPAGRHVNLEIKGLEASGTLSIYDNLGKAVFSLELPEGEHAIRIDLEKYQLSDGVYTVRLSTGETSLVKRLMIVR
ncbi:MAG: HYR domain-containing protein [Bacteroidia bacterium]